MEYNYTKRNLLTNPEYYMYSEYWGINFISAYRKNRIDYIDRVMHHIDYSNIVYENIDSFLDEFIQFDKRNRSFGSELIDISLYLNSTREQLKNGKYYKAKLLLKNLMHRFEIDKKIFKFYGFDLKRGSGAFDSLDNYIIFALLLARAFELSNNYQFLSSLLKVSDTILSLDVDETCAKKDLIGVRFLLEVEMRIIDQLINDFGLEL